MSTAHHEALYVAPNIRLSVNGSDGGEWWIDLLYVQPGLPPLLLNRLPCPANALAEVAALLLRAAEVAS